MPLYMKAEPDKTTGDNQMRECRDFSALERWAKQRTACFGYEHRNDGWKERMRYCPTDSPYLERIRKFYGYDKDWTPDDLE